MPPDLPVLPEAAVTPGAFRRISSLLQRDDLHIELRRRQATIRALEAALDGATLRIGELEAERDQANNTRLAAETMMREARDNLRRAYARVDELEAEREWKPWPPEVLDGRCLIANHCGATWLIVARLTNRPVTAYREIPSYIPPKGDDRG
jgi:hypothetical protein